MPSSPDKPEVYTKTLGLRPPLALRCRLPNHGKTLMSCGAALRPSACVSHSSFLRRVALSRGDTGHARMFRPLPPRLRSRAPLRRSS